MLERAGSLGWPSRWFSPLIACSGSLSPARRALLRAERLLLPLPPLKTFQQVLSLFPSCRRFLRETLKMSNAEDLNRLTACSLVLLGHIFYVLGNHRVSAQGQPRDGSSVVLGGVGHHQAALYILCPSMILFQCHPLPSPFSSMGLGKGRGTLAHTTWAGQD